MAETGVSILVDDSRWRPFLPPHVINSVRHQDLAYPGPWTPEQVGGYGPHPADRKIARWKRAGLITVKTGEE
jgi:hypothetical protein